MRVTEYLKKEHETISRMLTILEQFCEKIQRGEAVKGEDLKHILNGMGVFIYHCHHIKEETILFPLLKELGLPEQYRLMNEILKAHDLGRRYFEGLSWGIAEYRADPQKSALSLVTRATRYITFLNQEIEQEDYILFPLVDAVLSPEKEAQIIKKFDRVAENGLGEGKGDSIYQLLDRFSFLSVGPVAIKKTEQRR